MIMKGNEYRTISPTEANATSSRSHAVLQINVSQKDRNADVNEPHTMATLSIIDLAGSERASATKNRGDRLMEGANINKSLLALGSCINALCDPRRKNHVPYRNSKLTRLLKFSLGGNCRTVMIVCVSPSSQHFDETQNTLRYANRAKNIQTKVTRNVFNVNRHVKDFLKKIDEQMAMINELKAQQKEYENTAFVKFKKQSDKRETTVKEGIVRLRSAYEHSATERQEKVSNLRKLRQIERRIAMISSWVAAFDSICDSREDEEPSQNLVAMRKTAQGILIELEGSRQHYHQRLAKSNWERAIDTALQTGIRQLNEIDGLSDDADSASLTREADLLKSNAEREALASVAEQERGSDTAVVQALLSAHFDTIASLNHILEMDVEDATQAARTILVKILNACSNATSQVIKPDGKLPPVEAFPPSKTGTPKRRKQLSYGISPAKQLAPPSFASAPHLINSPLKMSPKRRKVAPAKKGVSFTPKKKSPSKRAVRWRDDTENGTLAEFEKTPQKPIVTPEVSSTGQGKTQLEVPPRLEAGASSSDSNNSSPIPTPPEPSIDIRPKNSRFQTGFLTKKSDGSPPPPQITNLSSSDTDNSPLRDMEIGKVANRSSLQQVQNASWSDHTPPDSTENSLLESEWKSDRSEAIRISSAVKRASSVGPRSASRPPRRRSPKSSLSGSPPTESALFTAGQARRMVRSDKENSLQGSVLSPRTAPVMKSVRRNTGGEPRSSVGISARDVVRLSGVMGSATRTRESAIGEKFK